MRTRRGREARFPENNHSMTQPNLSLSIGQIVNKLQSGQTVPQTEMPVYLGDHMQELIGFENLTKLEQIDFARNMRTKAQKAYDSSEQNLKEIEAQQAAEAAAQAILQKQQAGAQAL